MRLVPIVGNSFQIGLLKGQLGVAPDFLGETNEDDVVFDGIVTRLG